MTREHVIWADSRSEDDWTGIDTLEPKIALCETVGFVVAETDNILCIASTIEGSTNQCCLIIHIPQEAIRKRTPLKRVKKK